MEIPREIDNYLKGTIEESVGLPVSSKILRTKLWVVEEANHRLIEQQLVLRETIRRKDELLERKDELLERTKAEATMNALALKKFVEENQRLASECASLVSQCQKWENECALYDHDREALMDFGNEADERAKVAELRIRELEEVIANVSEELKYYKNEYENRSTGSCAEACNLEETMLENFLGSLVEENESEPCQILLDAKENDHCQQLLSKWACLKPSTRKSLLAAAKVVSLQNDKEHLRINLTTAEEEANLLFKENKALLEEIQKLRKQWNKERKHNSAEKGSRSASSVKTNKRKSSFLSSPIELKMTEINETEQLRLPLSPLQHNSPESRMYKK